MAFYTYLHCKPDGTPFYVGKGHGKRSHALTDRNFHHRNIVAKYGAENIRVFVFPCDSEAEAFADERRWIAQLRAEGFTLCNFTDGGEGCSGRVLAQESRAKISASNSGKVRTPEMRAKMSEIKMGHKYSTGGKGMLGKKHSAETKAKMAAAAFGNKHGLGNKNAVGSKGRTGYKNSPEHRANLRAAWIVRLEKKRFKKVLDKAELAGLLSLP